MNNLPDSGKRHITITVLFDNYLFKEKLKTGTLAASWGFSCLIEGTEKTILFDTGSDGEILLSNMRILGINPENIDAVVISHDHWDHNGGIFELLKKKNDIDVYILSSFPQSFSDKIEEAGANTIRVQSSISICKDVYISDEMGSGIMEQSMIIDTENGLIAMTGCAHPGIAEITEWINKKFNKKIYFLFGGFHLKSAESNSINEIIEKLKSFNVLQAGPTHCTGDKAIEIFKQRFGDRFVQMGVGKVIHIVD